MHLRVTRSGGLLATLASLCFSAACSSTMAPTAVITVENTPISQVKLMSVTRILAFGDSLTAGATGESGLPPVDPSTPGPTHSYPYKLHQLLAAQYPTQQFAVFNGGIPGERATESATRARLEAQLTQFSPEVMLLLHGVNDLNSGFSTITVTAGMAQLIDIAQSRGVYVILSALTRQRQGGQRAFSFALVLPYNQSLSDLATTRAVQWVDVYPLVTEPMIQPDGLHLTETANAMLAGAFSAVLRARFEYAAPK